MITKLMYTEQQTGFVMLPNHKVNTIKNENKN